MKPAENLWLRRFLVLSTTMSTHSLINGKSYPSKKWWRLNKKGEISYPIFRYRTCSSRMLDIRPLLRVCRFSSWRLWHFSFPSWIYISYNMLPSFYLTYLIVTWAIVGYISILLVVRAFLRKILPFSWSFLPATYPTNQDYKNYRLNYRIVGLAQLSCNHILNHEPFANI